MLLFLVMVNNSCLDQPVTQALCKAGDQASHTQAETKSQINPIILPKAAQGNLALHASTPSAPGRRLP